MASARTDKRPLHHHFAPLRRPSLLSLSPSVSPVSPVASMHPRPFASLPPFTSSAAHSAPSHGVGPAASDTPASGSAASTPRMRPTTLDVPGLTRSKVSPDGRIAQRDVGSKLVIVMVGLPARGKSYITKKMTRYLNWLQHDTRIFNVGERRRVAATEHGFSAPVNRPQDPTRAAASALLSAGGTLTELQLPAPMDGTPSMSVSRPDNEPPISSDMYRPESTPISPPDQSASFFDPANKRAAALREQCAMDTLDDLLDYILVGNGSVGIFDATNSTLVRRKKIMERIRERAGPVNVLFVESVCQDQTLLEANMRLKLSGPDYKDQDPAAALDDFRKRVHMYQRNYVPLGGYEEANSMPYVKMIDVGRKMITHQVRGFLASQALYYLANFNLAPRLIWITRHGESLDNVAGKIGGDSNLSPAGRRYARALAAFVDHKRHEWEVHQADKLAHTHFPPVPGDHTPPNPCYGADDAQSFCVWSSMLRRSVQSTECFCDDVYEIKQMRMLDELNAGVMEGLTYDEIQTRFADDFARRQTDKLAYRYPGPGGEGYLDIINRVRQVIVELERMTDHCLIVTHRSVARVLLAYFQGLQREDVADLDCPLGMLYQLEPKPYGVELKAWRWDPDQPGDGQFHLLPNYQLRRAASHRVSLA